jgi:hypothetical protein
MKRAIAAAMILIVSALRPGAARGDGPDTASAAPPYVLIMPPGMQLITVGDHHVLCPAEYAQGARHGLENLKPMTRPTTTASSILQKLAASRLTLTVEMATDLGLPREKVSAFLDGTMKQKLQEVEDLHANSYVIVATERQLTDVMKSGWHAPMFHYNQLVD